MESFKIENFLRDNPGLPALPFVTLTEIEAGEIWKKLALRAGRPDDTPNGLIQWIERQTQSLPDVNIEETEILLAELFIKSGIDPLPVLYVHWNGPMAIDRLRAVDLAKHFYDVWYPSVDDIEVFDDSLDWVMFVRHYGGVEIWRPLQPGCR